MRKWKAWLFALAVLIGIGTIGTVSMKAEAQNLNQGKRVLFISSYSYGWDTVQTQIEGIKAGVDEIPLSTMNLWTRSVFGQMSG